MFGSWPVRVLTPEERQREEDLARRMGELRDEAGLLRLLVVVERDPGDERVYAWADRAAGRGIDAAAVGAVGSLSLT